MSILEQFSKKNLPSHDTFQFKVIEKDPMLIIETSFIYDPSKNQNSMIATDEYNIGRVIKGEKDIYYLCYSNKEANLFKQNKDAWIKKFKQAYLAPGPRENREGRWFSFTSKSVYDQGKQLNYESKHR